MSWDIIARALFVDNNAAAGLKKFNDQVHDVAKAAPGGTRGVRMFEQGLRGLAFQAAGSAGPLGSMVGGLLQFSGGAGLVLGASAGIGLVGAAFKEMAADAKLAADNVEAAAKRLRESIAEAAKKAGGEGAEGVARFEERIAQAQERLDSLHTSPLGPQRFGATVGGLVPLGSPEEDRAADIRNTESLLGQLTVGLNAASKAAEEAAKRAIDSATRQADVIQMTVMIRERAIATGQDENTTLIQVAEVTARAAAAAAHLDSTQTAALVTQAIRNERLKEENRVLEAQRDLLQEIDQISADVSKLFATPQFQATLQSIRVPNLAQLQGAETARQVNLAGDKQVADAISRSLIGVGMGRTTDIGHAAPAGKTDVARIAAETVAVAGALQQGGAGGVVSATGGLLSSIKGIPSPIGIGLTALGGFVSLFDHGQERRQREMMEELRRIRQNTDHRGMPDRTSVTILLNGKEVSGALVDDVIYQINRMSRRDATPRLPS